MAPSSNGIVEQLDAALRDEATPRWAVPVLLCLRDDHCKIRDHIAADEERRQPWRQAVWTVLTALAVTITFWVLQGRFPQIVP